MDPAYDELVGAIAAQACTKGRNALTWPTRSAPVAAFPKPFDAADVDAVAGMLGSAGARLRQLADFPGQRAEDRDVLLEIAEHAEGAGQTLGAAFVR